MATRSARVDAESYADTGCGHGCERSLDCPFAVCIHDRQSIEREARQAVVLSLHSRGMAIADIIAQTGLSRRTVYRMLSSA